MRVGGEDAGGTGRDTVVVTGRILPGGGKADGGSSGGGSGGRGRDKGGRGWAVGSQ